MNVVDLHFFLDCFEIILKYVSIFFMCPYTISAKYFFAENQSER